MRNLLRFAPARGAEVAMASDVRVQQVCKISLNLPLPAGRSTTPTTEPPPGMLDVLPVTAAAHRRARGTGSLA